MERAYFQKDPLRCTKAYIGPGNGFRVADKGNAAVRDLRYFITYIVDFILDDALHPEMAWGNQFILLLRHLCIPFLRGSLRRSRSSVKKMKTSPYGYILSLISSF